MIYYFNYATYDFFKKFLNENYVSLIDMWMCFCFSYFSWKMKTEVFLENVK